AGGRRLSGSGRPRHARPADGSGSHQGRPAPGERPAPRRRLARTGDGAADGGIGRAHAASRRAHGRHGRARARPGARHASRLRERGQRDGAHSALSPRVGRALTSRTQQQLLVGIAALVLLGAGFLPLVLAALELAPRGLAGPLVGAAPVGAGPRRVVTRVLLPLAWPAAARSARVVFAVAFSGLGGPMFLRVRSYPAAVFARLGGVEYAPGEAFGLVVPLLGMALGLLGFERWLAARRSFPVLGLRQRGTVPLPLGAWKGPAGAIVWALAAF